VSEKKLSDMRAVPSGKKRTATSPGSYVTTVSGVQMEILSVTSVFDVEEMAFSVEVTSRLPGERDVHTYLISGVVDDWESLRGDMRSALDTFEKVRHGDHAADMDPDDGMGWQK